MAGAAALGGNPFSDDHILFDHDDDTTTTTTTTTKDKVVDDDDEAPSPKPFTYTESATRESSATVQGDNEPIASPVASQLIDLTPESVYMHPDHAQTASIHDPSAPPSEVDQAAQSFYSFTSSACSNGCRAGAPKVKKTNA